MNANRHRGLPTIIIRDTIANKIQLILKLVDDE